MINLEGDIWAEAQPFWSPDAINILDEIKQKNAVVVSGPHRVGKSRLLIPELIIQGKRQDFVVVNAPLEQPGYYGESLDLLFGPDTPGQKVAVYDESVSSFIVDKVVFRDLLVSLRERDITPVFINAGQTSEGRTETNQRFEEVATEHGLAVQIYEIQRQHLPEKLMVKYLRFWGAKDDLTAFFTRPDNKALLTPGVVGYMEDHLVPGEFYSQPPYQVQTVRNLKDYLLVPAWQGSRWNEWLAFRLGGSREDMLAVFCHLGIVNMKGNEPALAGYGQLDSEIIRNGQKYAWPRVNHYIENGDLEELERGEGFVSLWHEATGTFIRWYDERGFDKEANQRCLQSKQTDFLFNAQEKARQDLQLLKFGVGIWDRIPQHADYKFEVIIDNEAAKQSAMLVARRR